MKQAILISFLLIGFLSFCQTKDTITLAYESVRNEELDVSTINNIQRPEKQDFEGSYYFGASESESQLDVLFSNGNFFARTAYYEMGVDNWVAKLDRLSINYLDGKVIIDATEYKLATANNDNGFISDFYESEEGKTIHYIQFNPGGILEKPKGKYPESGFVKLTAEDLKGLSKVDLKLMRNELFARKGYVFKKGGKMDAYFSNQDWYSEIPKKDALDFNSIEKHNIELISKLEQANKANTSNSITQKELKFRDTILINYKEHKTLLNILKILPETTMRSWGWSETDRAKTVDFIEKNNFIVDSTKMFNNIKYIKPNTFGIEVVDGFWTMSIYDFGEGNHFVVTNDIVGDGNDIQTYNFKEGKLVPTKMVNWFSEFDYQLLINGAKSCIELLDDYQLSFSYDFSDTDVLEISSSSLTKSNAEHCLKGNAIKYKLNKKTKTFDITNIYWKTKNE